MNLPGLPAGLDGWAFAAFFGMLISLMVYSLDPYHRHRRWWQCPVCQQTFTSRRACGEHIEVQHWRAKLARTAPKERQR